MVTLKIKNVDALVSQFKLGMGARPTVNMRLSVSGPAADYALVWEWGRVDCQPGPKTLWGVNPDGETAVMTKTAPYGFIRVNREKYRQFVLEELTKINWRRVGVAKIPKKVWEALEEAAKRCADLIAETAPIDTGALRAAIRSFAVSSGEAEEATQDFISVRARVHRIK